MLETIGLARSFGALSVLRDVTLSIQAGERRAVIGPNRTQRRHHLIALAGDEIVAAWAERANLR